MKRSGDDRTDYLQYYTGGGWNDGIHSWFDGVGWNTVVIDLETGIAFTGTNYQDQEIPRLALAELIDEGFEP